MGPNKGPYFLALETTTLIDGEIRTINFWR